MSSKIDPKGLVFYALLTIIVIIVVLYVFNIFQFRTTIASLAATVTGSINNLGSIDNLAVPDIIKNHVTTISGVGLVSIPLIYTNIKSWVEKRKVKAELQAQKELSILHDQKVDCELEAYKKQLDDYKNDKTSDILQERLGALSSKNTQLEDQIKRVTAQYDEASKMPSLICEQLWAKSGGQVIEEGGHKYRIITETIKEVL